MKFLPRQIFTPNWIVKYMVQNTVGRIYLDNNPYTTLTYKEKWKYLVEPEESTPAEAILHYNELTDLKVADLACGSGHILNECFDLLYDLYITEGYTRVEAITHIFQDNLTGIDLDPRAQQLSLFALTLKACQRDHSFADAHCLPRVLTMPKVQLPLPTDTRLAVEIDAVNTLLKDADSLGSIMKFDLTSAAREWVASRAEDNEAAALVMALTKQYDALVMNPPYMGGGNMNEVLSKYVKDNYVDGKADLATVFVEMMMQRVSVHGRYAFIIPPSWMFLSTFEGLRKSIINNQTIDSLLHLSRGVFGADFGASSAVIANTKSSDACGTYFRLIERTFQEFDQKHLQILFEKTLSNHNFRYLFADYSKDVEDIIYSEQGAKIYYPNVPQANFEKIPGCPIGYWVSENLINTFGKETIGKHANPNQALITGNTEYYIKNWYEVSFSNIGINYTRNSAKESKLKWFPYNKGGNYRNWYGNFYYVVNWKDDGHELQTTLHPSGKRIWAHNFVLDSIFKEALVWSKISSGKPCFRYSPNGFLYDDASGVCTFEANYGECILSLLISKVNIEIQKTINPTLNIQPNNIRDVPFKSSICDNQVIINQAQENIAISKLDWDSHETSWDFQQNELISLIIFTEQDLTAESLTASCSTTAHSDVGAQQADESPCEVKLQDLMERYHQKWSTLFMQLHANEEELNRQFIDIYGLQDELTPDVPLNEITILQQGEVNIEGNALKWHDEVILKQLLSYAVGVWMGRYRLDKPGLHIAHPNPTAEELAPYTYNGHTIEIDDDGIFPLMAADSGFTDNACLRTAQFVSDVFGVEYQVENLNYIERTLGKTIEQYWQKDFWQDHKKMYQNHPIYWLFASKKGTFQCIAYLHRMTPYTPERIRSKYLLPFIETLGRKIADLTTRAADLSTAERKKLDTLNKQLEECREYHDRLAVVAEQAIPLDLDDGVVVNYAKLGDVVSKLK